MKELQMEGDAERTEVARFIMRAAAVVGRLGLTPDEVIVASAVRMGRSQSRAPDYSMLSRMTGMTVNKVRRHVASLLSRGYGTTQRVGHRVIVIFPRDKLPPEVMKYFSDFADEIRLSALALVKIDSAFALIILKAVVAHAAKDQSIARALALASLDLAKTDRLPR